MYNGCERRREVTYKARGDGGQKGSTQMFQSMCYNKHSESTNMGE